MGAKADEDRTPAGVWAKIRANPTGRLAVKIAVGVLGGLVVALGIVLIPFPGPGWAIVILGLAIWALEFAWAKNLLEFTKRHVQSWTHWIGRQTWPIRLLVGAIGMIFVSAVVWASVRVSLGIDLFVKAKDLLTG
jgi:uncharacterized protein (TIGR02611 family)